MMGYYRDLLVKDSYPVNTFNNRLIAVLQDFAAPFRLFTKSDFRLQYLGMDDELMQSDIRLRSETSVTVGRRIVKKIEFELFISSHGLERFVISENEKVTEVILIHQR
jgi:hypothetical protein